MIFLELNPMNVPVAILEILIILSVAALAGWFLSKLFIDAKLARLNSEIEERKTELEICRADARTSSVSSRPLVGNASKTVFPILDPKSSQPDDLKVIEGIGPKIEELLNREGISSYSTLSETSPIRLSSILRNAGPRFQIQDPSTWPQQALLAKKGNWAELETLKTQLIGGKTN
jgi:predicted flap endonuclease-1-like 5' DNA nuclease